MFQRSLLPILLVSCLFFTVHCASAAAGSHKTIQISIPHDFDPNNVSIFLGMPKPSQTSTMEEAVRFYQKCADGHGPQSPIRAIMQADVYDYGVDLADFGLSDVNPLAIFCYYPGYKAVTGEIGTSSSKTFVPRFEKLPRETLTIRLSHASQPLANTRFKVVLSASVSDYFRTTLPPLPSNIDVDVGSWTTDSNGSASIDVPCLLDDTCFTKCKNKPAYFVEVPEMPRKDRSYDIKGGVFDPWKKHVNTLNAELLYQAQVTGSIAESFLTRNGFGKVDNMGSVRKITGVAFQGQNGPTVIAAAGEGSEFSICLAPGTYSVSIEESSDGKTEFVSVDTIVLQDGEDRVLDIK